MSVLRPASGQLEGDHLQRHSVTCPHHRIAQTENCHLGFGRDKPRPLQRVRVGTGRAPLSEARSTNADAKGSSCLKLFALLLSFCLLPLLPLTFRQISPTVCHRLHVVPAGSDPCASVLGEERKCPPSLGHAACAHSFLQLSLPSPPCHIMNSCCADSLLSMQARARSKFQRAICSICSSPHHLC